MRKRVRAVATLGASATAFALLATTSPVIVSRAAWQDSEWTTAPIGVVDCGTTPYETRAEGALLSGGLLGIDLDDVADVHGMVVTSDGQQAIPQPTSAQPSGEYAWWNPLKVEALFDAISLELPTVRDLLQLPLDTDTGVLTQYGQAEPHGRSVGASGLVTNGGIIDLDPDHPPEPPADLATVNLMGLTSALGLGSLLEDVADLRLETGAVAARASLDACADDFGVTTLSREYAVTHVDLAITSEVLGDTVSALSDTVAGLETAVNTITGPALIGGITSGLSALLGGITGFTGLGDISAVVSASINLSAIRQLLKNPFGDTSGILTIDPGNGVITIHTAALLREAFPDSESSALNALAPNTSLLRESTVASALQVALTEALTDWVAAVDQAISSALDGIAVNASLTIELKLIIVPLASVNATIAGSLGSLDEIEAELSGGLLGLPLPRITSALAGGLGTVLQNVIQEVLFPTVNALANLLSNVVSAVVPTISTLYTNLFLDGIVDITLNAQNAPASGNPGPTSWDSLPPGQFDVAAIRIGILDALGELGVELFLGRASVGPGSATTIP